MYGSSAASSAYSPNYTGIGGSPDRGGLSSPGGYSQVVKSGFVSVKEEAFASFLWNRRYLVLKETVLSFHKNEVRISP